MDFLFFLVVALISLAAVALILWVTPWGPGVSPDSTTYLRGARSILAGNGYQAGGVPITHYPPFYSIALAAAGVFQRDMIETARWLNAALFGINLALVALFLSLAVGRSLLAVPAAMLFLASSAPLITVHAHAWSEPLFTALALGWLVSLLRYLARLELPWLVVSAALLGLALITRYIGMVFLPFALVLVLAASGGMAIRRRAARALLYLAIAAAPLAAAVLRNLAVADSATNRSVAFHSVALTQFARVFSGAMLDFLTPANLRAPRMYALVGSVMLLLLVLLAAVLLKLWRDHAARDQWRSARAALPAIALVLFPGYVLFIYLTITFLDAALSANTRVLSPVIFLLVPGVFAAVWYATHSWRQPWLRWAFVLLIALSIWVKAPESARIADTYRSEGLRYTSRSWRESPSLAFFRSLPEGSKTYSNGNEVIGFWTERHILPMPSKRNENAREANPAYAAELRAMCAEIESGEAYLIFFHTIRRTYHANPDELAEACRLPVLHEFEDGLVYGR